MLPSTFIGQVVKINPLWKAVRVRVQKMKLDPHITMVRRAFILYSLNIARSMAMPNKVSPH